jgi:DNA-binding transcriptional MerR regulator
MSRTAFAIPEKIFFKIGEVCDLVGVQPHVLRYWETEFPMLSPQKNRAGQRTYRRRDVEIALRIKELLYEDLYTIAGAKKKLSSELREQTKLKVVSNNETQQFESKIDSKIDTEFNPPIFESSPAQISQFSAPNLRNFTVPSNFVEPEADFDADFDVAEEFDHDEISTEKKAALQSLRQQLGELMQLLTHHEDTPRRGW